MVFDLLLGTFALLLLILPGWLIARQAGLPAPGLAGFILSSVGFALLIIFLEALGLGISVGRILPAWLVITLSAVLLCKRRPRRTHQYNWSWQRDGWLLVPVIPAILVVAYRAIEQPLFGIDTIFRWNFLAEQMLSRSTLDFYPPVSAADYEIYGWPDGMAPMVSALYFWGYSLAGAARPVLTAPFVIVQFLLLLGGAHALGRQLATPRAAAIACALVACSPIILWSAAMGQESGLLALALLGMILYLPSSRDTNGAPTVIAAGLAAALGGLAREYGLAFIAFGLALGLARRLPLRTLGIFLLTAAVAILPWYARNWARTGNPFFNLEVGGLFPVNREHLRLMQTYQGSYGWAQLPPEAGRIFAANCMAVLLPALAGIFWYFKKARSLCAAMLLVTGLWIASLSYTAAGCTYSLRVLTPGLVLAAVVGAMGLARIVPARLYLGGLTLALLLVATDASLRALVLPSNVYRIPPSIWLRLGGGLQEYHQRPVYRQLAEHTAGQRMLVLGPAALLHQNGARTVPPWSPEVTYLWSDSMPVEEAVRRLLESEIGYVLLNGGEVNRRYLDQISFFRRISSTLLQPIWSDPDMTLLKVRAPASVDPAVSDQH